MGHTHSKTDDWGGHRMLSFVKRCKRITDDQPLSLLLTLSLILVMASTLTEALELKRAGFVGMRGKKSDSIEVPTDDFYENNPKMLYQSKRQGFVGMRGKKSMDHEDSVNELFAAQNGADAERTHNPNRRGYNPL